MDRRKAKGEANHGKPKWNSTVKFGEAPKRASTKFWDTTTRVPRPPVLTPKRNFKSEPLEGREQLSREIDAVAWQNEQQRKANAKHTEQKAMERAIARDSFDIVYPRTREARDLQLGVDARFVDENGDPDKWWTQPGAW